MRETELCQKDLDFVIKVIAPDSSNKEKLKLAIQNDCSLRKSVIADDKLFNFLMGSQGIISEPSPALFFEILLRKAVREMEKSTYTIERTVSQRIPVFDTKNALELLENEEVFYYLNYLLASFAGTKSPKDIDSLIKLAETLGAQNRFLAYRRIGDLCLFVLGIFPEYLMQDYNYLFSKLNPPLTGEERRNVSDYEFIGQKFYRLAAEGSVNMKDVLRTISDNIYLAKKPLNFISEHYLAV